MANPLYKKLGLKDGQKVILKNFPENYFDLLEEVPDVEECEDGELADFVHIFESDLGTLQKSFSEAFSRLKQDGMIWISWPKKTAKIKSDIDYHTSKAIAEKLGMVDVKISAIDETWTACKYLIRKENRKN
jgi:hypothetical protein